MILSAVVEEIILVLVRVWAWARRCGNSIITTFQHAILLLQVGFSIFCILLFLQFEELIEHVLHVVEARFIVI